MSTTAEPDVVHTNGKRRKKADTPAVVPVVAEPFTPNDNAGVKNISLRDLTWTPLNPRKSFDQAGLEQLAASIRERGLLQPIIVRTAKGSNGKFFEGYIGERRFRAHQLLGAADIRAIVREASDTELRRAAAVENLQRADLGPMEEARAYADLMADDPTLTIPGVALLVSKDPSYVHRRLQLTRLPARAQEMVEQKILPFKAALELARVESEEDVAEIVKDIEQHVAKHWPVEVQRIVTQCHQTTRALKHAPWSPKDAELVPEAGACTTCPKATNNATTLFPDVEPKDNRCTDRACWRAKEVAFVKLRRGTAQKKAEKMGLGTVAISSEWDRRRQYPAGEEVPLSRNFYTPLDDKAQACPETKLGVCVETHEHFVGGMKLGDAIRICVNTDCPVHRSGSSGRGSIDRSRLEIKKKERRANAESDVRRAAVDAALAKLKWPLGKVGPADLENLRVMAVWILDRLYSDQPPALARALDLEYVAHKSPTHKGVKAVDASDYHGTPRDYSGAMGALRVYIDKLDGPGLLSFMMRCALFGDTMTHGSTDPHPVPRVEAFAARCKVPIGSMRTKRMELWAQDEKDRAAKRAATEKRKAAKAAKDKAKAAAAKEGVEQAESAA